MKRVLIAAMFLALLITSGARGESRFKRAALRDGSGTALREYDDAGRILSIAYFDNDGAPMAVKGSHTLLRDYDDAGNVIRERCLDAAGNFTLCSLGYAAVIRRFDAQGRATEMRYYDAQGRPAPCRQGYAAVEYFYGDGDKPILKKYYDADGAAADVHGCQQVAMDYDAAGNLVAERWLDAQGNRVNGDAGYAAVVTRYDDGNRVQARSYFDADGAPVVIDKGYAAIVTQRDADGNAELERYLDAYGESVAVNDRYSAVHKTYDQDGRVTSIEYLDAEGNLTRFGNRNYAMIVYDYDADGNRLSERYFDADRKPVIAWAGSRAATLWTYDDQGRVTSERYYDADGEPMFIKANYAGYTAEYSGDGTVQTLTYIRPGGDPVKPTSTMPYVKLRRTYDSTGELLLKEEYLDNEGNPTRNRAYVYGRMHEYDDQGREVRSYTFGLDGHITGGRSMAAITEYTYDQYGRRVAQRFTKSGQPLK